MKKKSVVAMIKADPENIKDSFNCLMQLLGGMTSLVLPMQEVVIKPNWVTDKPYTTGAVTHPGIIKECITHVLKSGAKKIYVGDSCMVGMDTGDIISKNNYRDMESARVKIVDFKKSEYIPVGIPNASLYRRLCIPREIMEAQVIINIPVMKTHDCLPVTLGLKNMKGVLNDRDKRRFHSRGLEQGIIDVNRIVLPDLTIIDGIIGMEGAGPVDGTPADARILIASFDPLAAEVAAIKAMGFDPDSMDYIRMAYEAGFGEKDFSKIAFTGDSIANVTRVFKSLHYTDKNFNDGRVVVKDTSACSACRFVLNEYIREELNSLKEKDACITLFAGDIPDGLNPGDGNTAGIGNCMLPHKEKFSCYIGGCPPRKRNIKAGVERIITGRSCGEKND